MGTKFQFNQSILNLFSQKRHFNEWWSNYEYFCPRLSCTKRNFMAFFRIARHRYYFNVCSSKGRRDNTYWASAGLLLLIKKLNVGRFLLRRFANLVRIWSSHIISRNHSNMFLLINLQKTKTSQSKMLQQGLFVLVSSRHFRQVFVSCLMFNVMQINWWLDLSSSLWEIRLCCYLFRKRMDQKNFLFYQEITESY